MTANIELPEWAEGFIDRHGDYWWMTDPRELAVLLRPDFITKRGPLRPVGAPLVAPEPPMSEPTALGTHVQCDDGEWVAFAHNDSAQVKLHGACWWVRLAATPGPLGNRLWSELVNPRPVDALTLDAVLAVVESERIELNGGAYARHVSMVINAVSMSLRAKFGATR